MSSSALSESSISLPEQALTAQAAALAQLRDRVAEAQAGGGKADPALVAEFARAQRDFLEAKIAFERIRKVQIEEEKAAQAAAEAEAAAAAEQAAIEAAAAAQAAAAARANRRLLTASRVFWLFVILLLTALLWFLRSPLAKQ